MKTLIKSKELLFLTVLTFIAVLIIACNTSPIFNVVGFDSGIFLTMGKMLLS